jgi:hypothetical protein
MIYEAHILLLSVILNNLLTLKSLLPRGGGIADVMMTIDHHHVVG